MEYRTVSTKLSSNELTLLRTHCDKKGLTPANLIRNLILAEMEITVPSIIAGKNKIEYDKATDTYNWSIILDSEKEISILRNISPFFMEDFNEKIKLCIEVRNSSIHKIKKDSVPIPSEIFRRSRNK